MCSYFHWHLPPGSLRTAYGPHACKSKFHARSRELSLELILISWQSACRWLSHKPGGRLPLFSTRPAATFPAKEITPLGQYQIILLVDMLYLLPMVVINDDDDDDDDYVGDMVMIGQVLSVSSWQREFNNPLFPWRLPGVWEQQDPLSSLSDRNGAGGDIRDADRASSTALYQSWSQLLQVTEVWCPHPVITVEQSSLCLSVCLSHLCS